MTKYCELSIARDIAIRFVEQLRPACVQIEIAGSIRRQAPWVRDIEIVAEPRIDYWYDLLGAASIPIDRLQDAIEDLRGSGQLLRNPGDKAGDRFKQFRVGRSGLKVDLFIVRPPAQWGSILAIRTGPADYSKWLVTPRSAGGAMPSHLRQRDGALWNGDTFIPTPTEDEYFAALGISPVPLPWNRQIGDNYRKDLAS